MALALMSPEQCRAARAWLGWSQQELARRARVGLSTVKDYERGDRRPTTNHLIAMREAIEEAGIRLTFRNDGIPAGIEIGEPIWGSAVEVDRADLGASRAKY